MAYGIVSFKIYHNRDYFSFEIVHITCLDTLLDKDGTYPPCYSVNILQLIRLARECCYLNNITIFDCYVTKTRLSIS